MKKTKLDWPKIWKKYDDWKKPVFRMNPNKFMAGEWKKKVQELVEKELSSEK